MKEIQSAQRTATEAAKAAKELENSLVDAETNAGVVLKKASSASKEVQQIRRDVQSAWKDARAANKEVGQIRDEARTIEAFLKAKDSKTEIVDALIKDGTFLQSIISFWGCREIAKG